MRDLWSLPDRRPFCFAGEKRWRKSPAAVALLVALPLLLGACGNNQSPAASNALDARVMSEGKALYEETCASCHGLQGEGQPDWKRPDAAGVYPAPPHNGSGHTWHHPDAVLLEVIAQGGSLPNSQMPAFAPALSEEEMRLTLAYIKTFWGKDELAFQREVSQ